MYILYISCNHRLSGSLICKLKRAEVEYHPLTDLMTLSKKNSSSGVFDPDLRVGKISAGKPQSGGNLISGVGFTVTSELEESYQRSLDLGRDLKWGTTHQ